MYSGKYRGAIFLDLKAAYDSVDRAELIRLFIKRFPEEYWAQGALMDLLKP
jgi:hypothetical protein